MIVDSLTGERKMWPMPFVVELQVAGGMSITKRIIRIHQDEKTVRRWIKNGELHAIKDIFGRYQISRSDLDAFREQRHRRYNPDDEA